MIDEKERVAAHIRLAFELLKEKSPHKYGEIDILGNRVALCTGLYSELAQHTECCGISVMVCNLQSSFDYFLCINNPTKTEEAFLKCHREAMEINSEI